ncbi:MFS transporter [Micromonospora sp. WMMD882]|nr:MFS transporter [Micromonospora sp. WMMD882]WBB81067.1 MFS transporter [Micromonospora sp. WMMD882]
MLPSVTPVPAARRLAVALYGYAFLGEFVLFYPVFALLFQATGLSIAQISSLFVLWTVAGVVLEVPSGALADTVSRRLLLVIAPLFAAAGFALWTFLPSYPAFAAGFLLWGVGGALASGTTEALVWTELERLDATDRYARLTGRARSAEMLGFMAAMGVAGPVLAAGGHRAVGAASVCACLLAALVATRLPERHPAEPPARPGPPGPPGPDSQDSRATRAAAPPTAPVGGADGPDLGWLGNLRAGLTEVRADPRVRGAVLAVPAVVALWSALDEYAPLLAVETGAAETSVPLLLLLVWGGGTIGGLLAPTAERLGDRAQPVLLTVAALALAGGAALGGTVGFGLVAVAFCGFQAATVLTEARLQTRITGPSRATVTSLAGMATDLSLLAVYAGYALAATAGGHRNAFVLAAVPYLALAALLTLRSRWGRRRRAAGPPVTAGVGAVAAGNRAPTGGRLPGPEGTWEQPSSSV